MLVTRHLDCLEGWRAELSSEAAVAHASPHAVVPRLLTPTLSEAVPPESLQITTLQDASGCVVSLAAVGPVTSRTAAVVPQLGSLTTIDVLSKSVSPDAWKAVARAERLTTLLACDCSDASAAMDHIGGLTALTDLSLRHSVQDVSIAPLAKLSSLVHLNLGYASVAPSEFEALGRLDSLAVLRLNGATITSEGLAFIARLPSLSTLDLGRCGVDTAAIAEVARISSALTDLDLSGCIVAGGTLTPLTSAPSSKLSTLRLPFCTFDATAAGHVASLPQLSTLILNSCDGIDNECLRLLSAVAQLRWLDLGLCRGFDADGVASLAALPQLSTLLLNNSHGVDDAAVAQLSKIQSLTHLQLSGCTVGEASVEPLLQLPRLTDLDMSYCGDLCQASLRRLNQQIQGFVYIECELCYDEPEYLSDVGCGADEHSEEAADC